MAEETKVIEEISRGAFRAIIDAVREWWNRKNKVAQGGTTTAPNADEKRGILVIGPGGTGKTTLARILSGDANWLIDSPWEYRESHNTELYSLLDDPGVQIVVPPGQKHRRESTWSSIHADLASDQYRGIIFVTAYGYHNLAGVRSYKQHPTYENNKDRFFAKYLEESRKDEVRILEQLVSHLPSQGQKLWFVSVVAKEDFWYPDRTIVEKHYREQEYSQVLRKIQEKCGTTRFRHEFEFLSLVISNLTTETGETLKKNVEGYDQKLQVESMRRLIRTLFALKTWEESS
jgi:hypothetical protein